MKEEVQADTMAQFAAAKYYRLAEKGGSKTLGNSWSVTLIPFLHSPDDLHSESHPSLRIAKVFKEGNLKYFPQMASKVR
jgi:hypothetical protein